MMSDEMEEKVENEGDSPEVIPDEEVVKDETKTGKKGKFTILQPRYVHCANNMDFLKVSYDR